MGNNTNNAPAYAGANRNVRRNRKVAPATSTPAVPDVRAVAVESIVRFKRAMQFVRLTAGMLETLAGVSIFVRRAMPADDAPLPSGDAVAAATVAEVARVFPGVNLDPAALVAAGKVAMAHSGAPASDLAARADTLEALTAAFGPAETPLRALFPDL
jgi:hypothetical protein